MDSWQRLFWEEGETLAFFLSEEFGEKGMRFMTHNPDDPFCDCPECLQGLEEAGLLQEAPDMLRDAEVFILARLNDLKERGMAGYDKRVECYTALAQVRQAQALEQIIKLLKAGIPVEHVS